MTTRVLPADELARVLAMLGADPKKQKQKVICPVHTDHTPSLAVTVRDDGSVDLKCWARDCDVWTKVASMPVPRAPKPARKPRVITKGERDAAEKAAKKHGKSSLTGYKLTAVYPYRDALGDVLFWKWRFEHPTKDKFIRPFYEDGSEWVVGEPDPPDHGKPLYRLPEVLASDAPVFVVEGEKCADALAALGIAATTSGAAKSAAAADWAPLAGRQCVIWPDNDAPGHKYAANVADALRALGCAVELVDVDSLDLPEKGDAVDWLAANEGVTAADVLALARTPPQKTPADLLLDDLAPIGADIWAAAATPHPHAFQDGHVGIFPVGEVTVVGSPGRVGKTTVLVAACARYLLGETLGGLQSNPSGPVVVLSAEDSPTQFARKLRAIHHFIRPEDWPKIEQRFIVPDFDAPSLAQLRQLVSMQYGQPAVAPEVAAIVDSLQRFQSVHGLGLVLIETASAWNAGNEDNPSFRALLAAAKQIARALMVAVVLTHHVNQSSGANLSKLDPSVADLRGGTTLVDNARQVGLLINLRSDDDPLPDGDARTVLRRMVAPRFTGKVSVLVFLNSSQGDDVPPLFFQWVPTDDGPCCIEIQPPPILQGRKWYAVREMVQAARPQKAESAKAAKVDDVVPIVRSMHKLGRPPTARAVSKQAGHSDTWATDALKIAVENGLLSCAKEKVPRFKDKVDVYRPIAPNA